MTKKQFLEARANLGDAPDPYYFMSEFHPDFSGCNNIAWMDDLERYLNGEYDPEDSECCATRMANAFPDKIDAWVEHQRLFCKEMLAAIEVYQSKRYKSGILPY